MVAIDGVTSVVEAGSHEQLIHPGPSRIFVKDAWKFAAQMTAEHHGGLM